jgi:hypothetical protein
MCSSDTDQYHPSQIGYQNALYAEAFYAFLLCEQAKGEYD